MIYEAFNSDDMYTVFNYAVRKNYKFVIVSYDKPVEKSITDLLGFSELFTVENCYRLYYYVGVKR